MLITRDLADITDKPYITFTVHRSYEDGTTICGFHMLNYEEAGRDVSRGSTSFWLPVKQAFENAKDFAKSKRISTIWINDPHELFDATLSQ